MPNAAQYLLPEVVRQVARLDLKARFIVEGFISGLHGSPYHGFSVEFSEHRKYEVGDEISSIDWALWGRTDRYYVKRYKAETNAQCHLVVDVSPSMGHRYRGMTKLEYATTLAAALALVMIGQQDPVGLITFDQAVRTVIPPRSKRAQLPLLFAELSRVSAGAGTDVGAALHQVADLVRHRGFVMIFSDLLTEPAAAIHALHHLAFRKHDLILFHVLDEAETTFPFTDYAHFEDVETGEVVTADPQAVREAYQARLREFIETFRKECSDVRVDFVSVDTSTPFDKALLSFLHARTEGR
ncbi:MAG: DUF58 domain-containing protein [Planctomycetes bacterium]|nr:DUF58 domain-containing protein [Planctomycetota bacterium]